MYFVDCRGKYSVLHMCKAKWRKRVSNSLESIGNIKTQTKKKTTNDEAGKDSTGGKKAVSHFCPVPPQRGRLKHVWVRIF